MRLSLQEIIQQLDVEISATPTGQDREDLTSAQIYLRKVEDARKERHGSR